MIGRMSVRLVWLASVCLIASSGVHAASCPNFDALRRVSYTPYVQLVVNDLRAIDRSKGDTAFNASVNALSEKYSRAASAGEANAVRRMIGIGLFTAMASNAEPLDPTFKLVCDAAKQQLPPRNVIDPLACAVMAVDGSRASKPANRQLAKEMIDLARGNLAVDLDKAAAQSLFTTVSQQVAGCLAQ
jgi:hypothetical protein